MDSGSSGGLFGFTLDTFPEWLRPWLRRARIDFRPKTPPPWAAVVIATVVAIVGSLAADAVLVKIGVAVYPHTSGYAHFQFSDYSKLTVIGVVIACVGWPIVARISSQPKWVFLRAVVLVTVVLLVPDAAIWYLGQPADAVFVLVWMHLAIAVVTFVSLITLAPVHGRHVRR